jgi:FMN phosphatase YigB (HAD superfamily)
MGMAVEVYDPELKGIYQAIQKICEQLRFQKKKIIILSNNQVAVERAGKLSMGLQKY